MRSWSETAVVRGILYMLTELFSGTGAGEVAASDILPSDLFGCEGFLTERREQGMRGLISLAKDEAREWCHAHQAGVSGPP